MQINIEKLSAILAQMAERAATLEFETGNLFSWHKQKTEADDKAKYYYGIAEKNQSIEAFLEARRNERYAAIMFENIRETSLRLLHISESLKALHEAAVKIISSPTEIV